MKNAFVLLGMVVLTGCASIVGQKVQPVAVKTMLDDKEIAGLACSLSNDEGTWSVVSPASTTVHKSTADLGVSCKNDGHTGSAVAVSKANGKVWGNILFGGIIGYAVDRNTGAGFDYPPVITVKLRQVDMAGIPANAPLNLFDVPLKPMTASQSAARMN